MMLIGCWIGRAPAVLDKQEFQLDREVFGLSSRQDLDSVFELGMPCSW